MGDLVQVGTWDGDGVRCEMMHQGQLRIEAMRVVVTTEVVVLKFLAQWHVSEVLTVEGSRQRVTCSQPHRSHVDPSSANYHVVRGQGAVALREQFPARGTPG